MQLFKTKKGSFLDFFVIPIFAFIAVVFLIVSFMTIHYINQSGLFTTDPAAQTAVNQGEQSLLNMDNMLLFVIIGLSLYVLIGAYFSTNHPAFFIFGVILLAVAVTIAAVLSDAYGTLTGNAEVASQIGGFVKIAFLMNKLPIYLAFMGFVTSICMYAGYSKNG